MKEIREIEEIKKLFKGALAYLESKKEDVNNLNVFPVPDGDTGTNMYLTMSSAIRTIEDADVRNLTEFADSLTKGALMGARGNSGVILSQIFRGIAQGFHGKGAIDGGVLSESFGLGAQIAYKAVKKPVKGTILTVMDGIAHGAASAAEKDRSFRHVLEQSIQTGNVALEQTPDLLPVLKEAGVVDAGGYGLMLILEGLYKTAIGDAGILESKEMVIGSPILDDAFDSVEDIQYTYCTEFIILEPNKDNEAIRTDLDSPDIGDSLVTIVADGIAKVHIHTNHPGKVLEYAIGTGTVTNIKIENMKEQFLRNNGARSQKRKKPAALKEYGFIMVVPGPGLEEIARSMGVDAVIEGGQTMNPSTKDIQEAIDTVDAKVVYVFPNNKNIIMAAEQTVNLNLDKKIVIVPTVNVQQGFNSILNFAEDKTPEENVGLMKESFGTILTGSVTYAVRDTSNKGLKIKKDQILVLGENEILAAKTTVEEGVLEFLRRNYKEQEILSLYYGEMVREEEAAALKETIEKEYKDLEVHVYAGRQPVYFYLLSLE